MAKKTPLVLLICVKDYANVAYTYQQALRSVGVNAVAYASKEAGLKYPERAELYLHNRGIEKQRKIISLCIEAKVIIWMHSQYVDLGLPPSVIAKKRLVVFHGGTRYRLRYNELNQIFNPMVKSSLIQTLDLWGLGAKNQVWMLPAINTDLLRPTFQPMGRRKVIAHYPHVPLYKGSEIVNRAVSSLKNDPEMSNKFEYLYSHDDVSWSQNISRIRKCDIYIESLSQATTWNRHDWSVTALEAASLGKIVVTNMLDPKRYKKEYGSCALHIANTEEQLVGVLRNLLMTKSDAEIQRLKANSRAWVERAHSYQAIGARLKNVLGV